MERTSVRPRLDLVVDDSVALAPSSPSNHDPFLLATLIEEPCPVVGALAQAEADDFARSEPRTRSGRLLDICLSLMLLFLVLPLMAVCALAVRISSQGPILFRHPRIGLNGREFVCLKFRTMRVDADLIMARLLKESEHCMGEWLAVQKLRHDPRVTPIGSFLRRYCLDELPQLLNVLAGDMSIVGPRPIVAEEVARYGPAFADYCSVKPGLTGLWQVSGRHSLSYDERVRLDAEYARSKSAVLDLRILFRTVPIVMWGQNT